MSNMNAAYFRVTLDGEIIEVSDFITEISGYTPQELKGKNILDFYANQSEREKYKEIMQKQGFVRDYELQLIGKHNQPICISLNSTITYNQAGEVSGFEGLFHNITDLKKAEKALIEMNKDLQQSRDDAIRANAAKTDFLSVMSHELRTPLHGIIGMHDLLSDMPNMPEEHRINLAAAQQASKSLRAIVNDILDLTKVEAGEMTLNEREIDIEQHVCEAMQAFVFSAREKNLAFELILKNIPQHIIIDPLLLRQILFNLVGNAIKFTNSGYVKVTLMQAEEDSKLQVSIEDTGIGLSEKDIESIFEPFFQAHQFMDHKRKGTGLGTSIVKRFVELMHGKIWVHSVLGKGSNFCLSVPYKILDHKRVNKHIDLLAPIAKKSHIATPAKVEENNHTPYRVLLAEDDNIGQRIASKMLQREGLRVDIVSNGQQAFEMAQKHEYHIILMDIRMPIMDGIQATRRIRDYEYNNGRKRATIIGLSAHAFRDIEEESRQAGMDDFLTKPFDSTLVSEYIAKYTHAEKT